MRKNRVSGPIPGAGRPVTTGVTQTSTTFRLDNDLVSRLTFLDAHRQKSRFINEAIRQRLDRLDNLEENAMNAE